MLLFKTVVLISDVNRMVVMMGFYAKRWAFMPSDGLLCQAKMGFSQFVMIVHVAHVVSIV